MSSSSAEIPVALPRGEVRLSADIGDVTGATTVVAIAHGAGAGREHPFLRGFADGLQDAGIATVRFDFPYRQAGRRMPGPAAHAVAAWAAVAEWIHAAQPARTLWAAGKSYGGRMASMAAADGSISPAGLVYLGYPLHPPGEPAKERSAHLPAIPVPQLFVEGTKDAFVVPHDQLVAAVDACTDARIHWIEGGGHSFEVAGRKRPADEIGRELAGIVAPFVSGGGQRPAA